MRIGRTLTLLTLFAGIATWFATREAMRRTNANGQTLDTMRWDDEGGSPNETADVSAAVR